MDGAFSEETNTTVWESGLLSCFFFISFYSHGTEIKQDPPEGRIIRVGPTAIKSVAKNKDYNVINGLFGTTFVLFPGLI